MMPRMTSRGTLYLREALSTLDDQRNTPSAGGPDGGPKDTLPTLSPGRNCWSGRGPCVIVLGLDETYFRYYNREWAGKDLPNVLTVAATRASAFLVLITNARTTLRTVDVATLARWRRVYEAAIAAVDRTDTLHRLETEPAPRRIGTGPRLVK